MLGILFFANVVLTREGVSNSVPHLPYWGAFDSILLVRIWITSGLERALNNKRRHNMRGAFELSTFSRGSRTTEALLRRIHVRSTFLIIVAVLWGFAAHDVAAQIPISSIEQLQLIGNDSGYPLNGTYVLTTNINASATATWNGGAGFDPIGNAANPFTGVFDGAGYVITGLVINRPSKNEAGLFGRTSNSAEISNLGLVSANISANASVGALVGYNQGTITSCYATGTVAANNDSVGGLVGKNYQGTISLSYAKVNVTAGEDGVAGGLVGENYQRTVQDAYATGGVSSTGNSIGGLIGYNYGNGTVVSCYATGSVSGNTHIGGLIGYNHLGSVSSCYARGNVSGEDYVAGFVGTNSGSTITFCYATGAVSSAFRVGGFAGPFSSGTITSSYWNVQTSGQSTSGGGDPRTTADMTHPYGSTTYVGWDFSTIWAADTDYAVNGGYPYLRAFPLPTGTVVVNVSPGTATWTLSGPTGFSGNGTTYTGNQTFTNVPVGTYTWTGNALSGYNTPSSQTATLANGSTITFNKTWTLSAGGGDTSGDIGCAKALQTGTDGLPDSATLPTVEQVVLLSGLGGFIGFMRRSRNRKSAIR